MISITKIEQILELDARARAMFEWIDTNKKVEDKNFQRSFVPGQCYRIDDIDFRYVETKGIHHCFVAVKGGWTRTYTDYQLVGK